MARRLHILCRAAPLLAALLLPVPPALAAGTLAPPAGAAGTAGSSWSAERLYREGLRADGSELLGERAGTAALRGEAAACVHCHRRSGLGTSEGKSQIPPISGDWLFQVRTHNLPQPDAGPAGPGGTTPAGGSNRQKVRHPYDAAGIARALREGLNSDGEPLSLLMPRYALSDQEIAALLSYLRTLGTEPVPGVDEESLHFATVVTPDADPRAAAAMLDTLRQFFQDRNHIIAGAARPLVHNERGILYRVTRRWTLHVWTLEGPAAGWEAQLRRHFAEEPVFALVSGMGGAQWSPVHHFCEAARLPCLFPNVDLPVDADRDFYSLYFSRGVLLEAELLAEAAAEQGDSARPSALRLVQVARRGSSGEAAARRLASLRGADGTPVETRLLAPEEGADALARAVRVDSAEILVLWLDAADIAALPEQAPPAARILLSGLLAGLEQAPLPAGWRHASELSYPYELPERRALALRLPEGWFRIKGVALTDPRVEFQTYVACQILAEMVAELHVSFLPDYLVERTEVMLSHRQFNGMYPRLSLGPGQRFASKGAYLVHLPAPGQVVPDGDWRVP